MAMSGVKALTFDVFGTVVDYRGTIIREGERLNRAKGLHLDWAQSAQAQGMQAAFVSRPLEGDPDHMPDLTPDPAFEVVATDFMDLAQQLGTEGGHHQLIADRSRAKVADIGSDISKRQV